MQSVTMHPHLAAALASAQATAFIHIARIVKSPPL
jgi:hypothetical protein